MKKLLVGQNDVLIAIGNNAETVENGIKLDNTIYPFYLNLVKYDDIEVSAEIVPHKYCYNVTDGFFLNPNYKEPLNTETEVLELKDRVTLIQQALDDLILGGAL